ncbi:hypothetical protein A9Q87_04800 [Flavobacteriales bacterium 34_180_T64]|nr:hypothetical protein A9Q87_04800 [Flavobacteriales bacterium 34_180_T64]
MKTIFYSLLILAILVSCNKKEPNKEQLGVVKFNVYGNKDAQLNFKKGLLLLHSFEYEDAREEFKKAQFNDPEMGMAYWGEAMTYNHSLWGNQDYDEGYTALQNFKAAGDLNSLTDLEQDFLDAAEILYEPQTSKNDRDIAYKNFMEGLHKTYPDNQEVAAFYSISLLGSVPEGRNDSIYGLGAKVAQKVLLKNPEHPGALHYLIHSYDDPVHAKLAINAANSYAKVAPDASHALHMPSHIYVALGMWDEVVISNINSYQASINRMNRKGLDNNARGYHAYHWLEYGYLQQNKIEDARQMVLDMGKYTLETPSNRSRAHLVFLKGTFLVESNDWDSTIADIPVDISNLNITVQSKYRYLEAYKAFKNNDEKALVSIIDECTEDIKAKSLLVSNISDGFTFCASLSRDTPTQTNIDESLVMLIQMQALQAWMNNNIIATERWLKDAVAAEKKLSYSYGPPVIQKPTYELYADWLMSQNRFEEANTFYEKTLKMATKRRLATEGKKEALIRMDEQVVQL